MLRRTLVHAARGEEAIGINVIPPVDRAITEFEEVEEKVIEKYNKQETRSKRGGTVFLVLLHAQWKSVQYHIGLHWHERYNIGAWQP